MSSKRPTSLAASAAARLRQQVEITDEGVLCPGILAIRRNN